MRYPGADSRYAICDVCGGKFRIKHLTEVRDQYNLQNGMLVCKKDLDEAQPLLKPVLIRDKLLHITDKIRPDTLHPVSDPNPKQDRLPSMPRFFQPTRYSLGDPNLGFTWQGPDDMGDSRLLGWRITVTRQYDDILINIIDINIETWASTYYNVEVPSYDGHYIIRLYAVTDLGDSPYSEYIWNPIDFLALAIFGSGINQEAILQSQNGDFILVTQAV